MRSLFYIGVYLTILYQVLSAPAGKETELQSNEAEQELVRHHHATNTGASESSEKDSTYSSDDIDDADDDSSIFESVEEVPDSKPAEDDNGSYDEDDLYDITVGDVIRDVILTLRDHPEIVKELIASEREKLAERIDTVNAAVDFDSVGDHLSTSQEPAQQLKNKPNSVEKNAVRSEMPVIQGDNNIKQEDKRKDEVIDDNYGSHDLSEESRNFQDFITWPLEGGQDNSEIDYERNAQGGVTAEESKQHSEKDSNSGSDSQETEDESVNKRNRFRLPFMYPRLPFLNFHQAHDRFLQRSEDPKATFPVKGKTSTSVSMETENEDTKNESQEMNTDKTSKTRVNTDTSEDELSWLLQKARAQVDENSSKTQPPV